MISNLIKSTLRGLGYNIGAYFGKKAAPSIIKKARQLKNKYHTK